MRIAYDPEVDALSIVFCTGTVTTEHLADGIVAAYNALGELAGLEILDAAKRVGGKAAIENLEISGICIPP